MVSTYFPRQFIPQSYFHDNHIFLCLICWFITKVIYDIITEPGPLCAKLTTLVHSKLFFISMLVSYSEVQNRIFSEMEANRFGCSVPEHFLHPCFCICSKYGKTFCKPIPLKYTMVCMVRTSPT